MSVSYKKLWKLLIDKDMKKKDLEKAAGISNYDAVVLMGLFTFLFLGAEYLYVDVLSRIVSEDKTVLAQNYTFENDMFSFYRFAICLGHSFY